MKVIEHKSAKYPPRTEHNANSADLTVAFAEDYESGGERLTKKLAEAKGKERYIALPLHLEPIEAARLLWKRCKDLNVKVLNVAGNGIYTLSHHGWTENSVNEWVYQVFKLVTAHHKFDMIISGGQTGADFAGGVVAEALGIDAVMTFPNGFLQRTLTQHALTQTESDVLREVAVQLQVLRDNHPELQALALEKEKTKRNRHVETGDDFSLS